MKDAARAEEAPRIEISSQTTDDLKNTGQKRSIRILHVDDDPCILDVSRQILAMENNFEVDTATSVDEALKKMERQTYDAVVSDYEMPLRNGLDFLKELRERQNDVPFILFTGKGREEVVVIALNLCADSYINKHGSPETVYLELADAIKKTVERKKSREVLVASESKYRTLVEKSLQGILVTKVAPLKLVFANDAMGKFLGYSCKELTSLSPEGIMGLVYHEDRAVFFKRMENRFRGEPGETCLEFRAVRKDGSVIWLSAFANRVDFDGQPAVLGMFLDINERKKAGDILRESEQRYRELANSLPDIVFETDINGQLVFANERATEISGYSPADLEKGLNLLQFLIPEDRERATKNIQRLLAGGRYAPAEYTFVRKDGTTFAALITAAPCISKGKVTGLRGLVLDTTERKKAEKALKASEEQLKMIFEGASDGIIVANSKTKSFVFANPRICEITGYSMKELLKLTMSDIHPERDLPSVTDQFTKQVQGKITLATNVPILRKDRKVIYCDINSRPAKIGEQEYLVGFFRDITEHKRTEEVLRESEESFRSLIDSMDDLVFVLGFDGVFKNYHQPSHEKELYAAPEEFVGKHFRDVLPPQVAESCQAAMKRIEASGESQEFDYYIGMNGGRAWYNARLSPTKDQSGRKASVTVVVRNITERKQNEEALNRTMDELVRVNEKLNIVGSLTRHDVRNKLCAVTANAFMIKKKHADQPDIMDWLSKMEQSVKDVVKIFDFAKMYEELGVGELTYVDVEKTMNEAVALFPSLTIKVVNDCHGLTVLADAFLRQLFYNLIDNTKRYGKKTAVIRVYFEKAESDKLRLIYEDDGVGISTEDKLKLFTEGFSTGGSTGFGLFLIKKMADVYGWQIQETGEPGKGARFTIVIPRINLKGKENIKIS